MPNTKRVHRRSGVSRYQQLYTLISESLADGSIKAGAVLPTETALMRQYDVSRNTVRRALEKLEHEKRIVRRRGSGSFAREQPGGGVTLRDVEQLLSGPRDAAIESTWDMLHFGFVQTPPYVLDQVPKFTGRSLLIQRMRSLRGRPFALLTSYLAEHIGKLLNRRRLGKRALLLAVEEAGVKISICKQAIVAITANAIVAERLRVPVGAALVHTERICYADDDSPVEFAEMTCPSNLYRHRMVMRMDRGEESFAWLPTGQAPTPGDSP